MLDLGQPRLALLKGAGDVTTHGSPLGKWLLGRGRARRGRSARLDAAGAGALRPSATSECGVLGAWSTVTQGGRGLCVRLYLLACEPCSDRSQ